MLQVRNLLARIGRRIRRVNAQGHDGDERRRVGRIGADVVNQRQRLREIQLLHGHAGHDHPEDAGGERQSSRQARTGAHHCHDAEHAGGQRAQGCDAEDGKSALIAPQAGAMPRAGNHSRKQRADGQRERGT